MLNEEILSREFRILAYQECCDVGQPILETVLFHSLDYGANLRGGLKKTSGFVAHWFATLQ